MAPKKVLVVLTSFKEMPNGHQTGWYLPEFAHPYYDFIGEDEANPKVELTVVSPAGGATQVDPHSVQMFGEDPECKKFFAEKKHIWEQTLPLADFVGKASEFDAVFYPGGHGPMFDLINDENSIKVISEFYNQGKPVAALCHGSIVFVNVNINGEPLLKGRKATGFSNEEETIVGMTPHMPVLLEDEIQRVGGIYSKAAEPWGDHVLVDGQVITGQNPGSAHSIAKALLKALEI
ncbi:class I glutamine amidotransferase-like protein [Mariannaea sp. PMI_226]|nr:class I glutamine amidotransferase-like protein [Mariannaea sp. PMI_226]